jgi:PAS domain S-box-containing protein
MATKPPYEALEQRIKELENELRGYAQAEERLEHLNRVLRSIRNVNQLIVREKDRTRLLKAACENLVQTRGYFNAWIALLDETGQVRATAESGLGKGFLPMADLLKKGVMTGCGNKALSQAGVVVTTHPHTACTDCPLSDTYRGRGAMTVRLEHSGKICGLLSASIPRQFLEDQDELFLFHDVARDLALALHGIEVEEKRKQAEEALRESEAQKKAILDASIDRIRLSDTNMRIIWANETYNKQLNIAPEDMVGKICYEVFVGRDRPCPECPTQKALKSGNTEHAILVRSLSGNEENRYLDSYAVPMKDESGRIGHILQVTRDITEKVVTEKRLRESEERYRNLFEGVPVGLYRTNPNGKVLDASMALVEILGYPNRKTILQTNAKEMYVKPQDREFFQAIIEKQGTIYGFETKLYRYDGTTVWVEINARAVKNDAGSTLHYEGSLTDITARKEAEEELKKSQENLKRAQQIGRLGNWDWDVKTGTLTWSDEVYRIFGVGKDFALTYENIEAMIHPDDRKKNRIKVNEILTTADTVEYEFRIITPDGAIRHIYQNIEVSHDQAGNASRIFGIIQDVTARKQAEARITHSLKEKELLLKEIHHRVKNNMQVIASLLKLQAAAVNDERLLAPFQDAEHRVRAMSLVHEKLYQSEDFTRVPFRDYLASLIRYLSQSYEHRARHITVVTEIEDLPLDIAAAIPCGLIVNELVSNAFKHAFPEERAGTVTISLRSPESGAYELTVKDDGIGIPEAIDIKTTQSLGLHLVSILAEDQLRGSIEVTRDGGSAFRIMFGIGA